MAQSHPPALTVPAPVATDGHPTAAHATSAPLTSQGALAQHHLTHPTWSVTSRQRDPPVFAGLRGDDVEDWLQQYDRVSAFNGWDASMKLLNVSFYLSDVAKTWFLNHEDAIPDWPQFTTQIRQIFGTVGAGPTSFQKKLETRVQLPGETYTSYIEDVLALCRRVNNGMVEAERVGHILKGIGSFAYAALAAQNPVTVADIRATCQRLDYLQSRRLNNTWDPSQIPETDLRTIIRSIIREELHNDISSVPAFSRPPAQSTGLRGIIKEELTSLNRPMATEPPAPPYVPTYAEVTAAPPPCPPVHHAPVPPSLAALSPRPPVYGNWRPLPPRPVCFYCGIRGHVTRVCRRRLRDERASYGYVRRDDAYQLPPRQYYTDNDLRPSSSPSTSPDRSRTARPSRRRSPSPFRRTSSPLRPPSSASARQTEN